jgi:hypothetical protein
MRTLDLPGIAARIDDLPAGDVRLVGWANAMNASVRDDVRLTDEQRAELERLRRLALDKACG